MCFNNFKYDNIQGGINMPSQNISSSIRLNYLFVEKYVFPSVWGYPRNKVPYSMLRLIVNGSGEFEIDNQSIIVKKNQIIYIPQGCDLQCRALEDDFTFISIRFTAAIPLNEVEVWSESLGIKRVTETPDPLIQSYFDQMVFARTSSVLGKAFRLRGYLELIIAWLIDANAENLGTTRIETVEKRNDEQHGHIDSTYYIKKRNMRPELEMDSRIQAVIEYMIAHQYEEIDLKQLCEMVEISFSSLRRLFKKHTGKAPSNFIKDMKMMSAARRLLGTDDRISKIAYDLGFDNPNYFTRMFKNNFGISPLQYRRVSRD
jgi:AraC-like DNA-binding protein